MCLFIIAGLWGVKHLNAQFFPDFELDYINIGIVWSGATAEDIERSITIPVEQELQSLTNVRKTTSTSLPGKTSIYIELEENTDIGNTLDQVKQRIESIRNFPREAQKPVIKQLERYSPVANILVSGSESLRELSILARQFEKQLLNRGIQKIDFVGMPREQIAIQVSSQTLHELGLSLDKIAMMIDKNSRDLPAGTAAKSEVSKEVRSLSQQRTIQGFEQLPLLSDESGRLVRLGDIATIERRPMVDEPYLTWKDKPAIEMRLMRTPNEDTLDSAEILNQWLDDTLPTLPHNIQVQAFNERWKHLKERINLLLTNGAGGLVLVVIILFLFLNVRVAFWVTIGIPVSFLATLAILKLFGGSINMISLFALIMALGIIVDDAIVVGEDTLTHVEMGENALSAAIGGAQRMLVPVLCSSMTTIAAFMPLTMLGGVMGKMAIDMPIVIICVIIASIIECFLILPGHLHHSLKKLKPGAPNNFSDRFNLYFFRFREEKVRPMVITAIRYRGTTILIGVCCALLAISIIASGHLKFTFFPTIDGNEIRANVEFTPGTPKAKVDFFLEELERSLKQTEKEIGTKLVNIAISNHGRSSFNVGRYYSNEIGAEKGSLILDMTTKKRPVSNSDFIAAWRKNINMPAGIQKFTITQRTAGPPGKPIAIQLTGNNISNLKEASVDLQRALSGFNGVTNIDDDLPFGKEQLIYELTPTGRATGLDIESAGAQLRAGLDGTLTQIFYDQDDEIEVRVTLPEAERESSRILEEFPIILADGNSVPLNTVIAFTSRRGVDRINHTDGLLNIIISADLDTNIGNANEILASLDQTIFPQLKQTFGVGIGLEGKALDQAETMNDMKTGALIGLSFIYIILAWVFSSYSWPLAVMTAIPLGLTGAIFGHLLTGNQLSMFSFLGLFGLSGIVVNDSIILITFYQKLRLRGLDTNRAIVEAICARFRAVLLTTLTTIAGLTPILFETSLQAQFLIPMAVSIVFGLAYGTFLILFFVPALLTYIESARSWLSDKQLQQAAK